MFSQCIRKLCGWKFESSGQARFRVGMPCPLPCLVFAAFLLGTLVHDAAARVGESRASLEGRMLSDRTALRYPDAVVRDKLGDRNLPYRNLIEHMPQGVEHVMYFKRADGSHASNRDIAEHRFPDGWDLHVIYYQGVSVFEAYRRNGPGLSPFEEQGLLGVNRGDSHWNRVAAADRGESAIGYTYERDDGYVRARREGRHMIFFRPGFDQRIQESLEAQRAKIREEQQAVAPDSIKGF